MTNRVRNMQFGRWNGDEAPCCGNGFNTVLQSLQFKSTVYCIHIYNSFGLELWETSELKLSPVYIFVVFTSLNTG